nr:hypothetical protein [Klebsiella pneumoniae]
LFNFLSRLKKWARQELMRQDPKDVIEAFGMADRLADSQASFKSVPEEKVFSTKNSGESTVGKPKKRRDFAGKQRSSSVSNGGNVKCYNCKVFGHMSYACTKPRRNLAAVQVDESSGTTGESPARVNPIQLCNA